MQLGLVNPRMPDQIFDDPNPIPEGGYILVRGQIAQPPGSTDMWLPCQYNNFINPVMTADSALQAAIHKVNINSYEHYTDNRVVLTAVRAHRQDGTLVGDGWDAHISGPIDIAFSADGTTAYVVNMHSNDVVVFPADIGLAKPAEASPLTEIPVGENPIGIIALPHHRQTVCRELPVAQRVDHQPDHPSRGSAPRDDRRNARSRAGEPARRAKVLQQQRRSAAEQQPEGVMRFVPPRTARGTLSRGSSPSSARARARRSTCWGSD